MQSQEPADIWRPALVAGTIFGLASAIPLVGLLNCACCSLVVGSGLLSCFMMVKGPGSPVTWGRAALSGAMAGVIAAIIMSMGEVLMTVALGRSVEENLNEAIDRAGELLPNSAEAAQILSQIPPLVFIAFKTVFAMAIYAPFGALGGVIGRALFEKRAAVPPAAPGQTSNPPGPPPSLDI